MFYEISESFRIAFQVIRAHKMRSVLTALGVIIGIVAVTLMGSAISGIEIGFERSLAVIGDDLFYVEKWPWHHVDDWWNYRNRRRMEAHYAEDLKRLIKAAPNSLLVTAVPTDVNLPWIAVPRVVIATTLASEIRPASNAYSIKS